MALSEGAERGVLARATAGVLDGEALMGYLANALILAGFPVLFGLFLLPMVFNHEALPNVIWPSAAIILLSLLFLGTRALTATVFDYLIVAWLALAVMSHFYATMVLQRELSQDYLLLNLGFIVSMGLMLRAVFCLILINPTFATRVFAVTVILGLSAAAVLGLMQKYGPASQWASDFAMKVAPAKEKVMEGMMNERPVSIFGGPNLLGYADTVLACFALGWGLTNIKNINALKVVAVMALFGFVTLSAVASQSRSTVLLLGLFPLLFGIQLRRRAGDQFNTALFSALFAVGVFCLLYVLQTGKFEYLYSVRHTGIQHDVSYTVRMQALSQLGQISSDIAPLGSGVGENNNPHMDYQLGYDRYSTLGVDNDWANAFEAFGVLGPLWLVAFFGVWVAQLSRLRGDPRYEPTLVYYIGGSLLVAVLILTPTAVRVMKYETAGFEFYVLGAVAAWSLMARPVRRPRKMRTAAMPQGAP